jgi:hypothetical protein
MSVSNIRWVEESERRSEIIAVILDSSTPEFVKM